MTPTNVRIFRQDGRYAGWPANGGMWAWGNEIVISFGVATYKKAAEVDLPSFERPVELYQARTLDGGEHWNIEKPSSLINPLLGEGVPTQLREPIEFAHPDFAMMFKFDSQHVGPSWFYTSIDRCHTWSSPTRFDVEGMHEIAARTDYIVRNDRHCIVFASRAKQNHLEGRSFCAETRDGGLHWSLLSTIGPEPEGYMIMPSTVPLHNGSLLTALRHKDPDKEGNISIYSSHDEGHTWQFITVAAPHLGPGNPPSLLKLQDGRLALIYGYRARPYGIRARISENSGVSWGEELILRNDGIAFDMGYVRSVERPDGAIVSAYYFNGPDHADRTVEALIWRP